MRKRPIKPAQPEPTTVVGLTSPGLPTRLYRVPVSALPRLEHAEREARYRRALQAGRAK